jgi:hypothetical protein
MHSVWRRTGLSRLRRIFLGTMAMLLVVVALPAHPAMASRSCEYFDFWRQTNTNSTLAWKYYGEGGTCNQIHTYRAGSGISTDACWVDHGWLPTGWYDLQEHQNGWNGSAIWGRVWYLQDKACSDGTLRTALFIHTEETVGNTQTCTSNTDDTQCWDGYPNGNATNDYYSAGCIKVRRDSTEHNQSDDMPDVHSDWHNLGGGSGQHGVFRSDSVYVHG